MIYQLLDQVEVAGAWIGSISSFIEDSLTIVNKFVDSNSSSFQ